MESKRRTQTVTTVSKCIDRGFCEIQSGKHTALIPIVFLCSLHFITFWLNQRQKLSKLNNENDRFSVQCWSFFFVIGNYDIAYIWWKKTHTHSNFVGKKFYKSFHTIWKFHSMFLFYVIYQAFTKYAWQSRMNINTLMIYRDELCQVDFFYLSTFSVLEEKSFER